MFFIAEWYQSRYFYIVIIHWIGLFFLGKINLISCLLFYAKIQYNLLFNLIMGHSGCYVLFILIYRENCIIKQQLIYPLVSILWQTSHLLGSIFSNRLMKSGGDLHMQITHSINLFFVVTADIGDNLMPLNFCQNVNLSLLHLVTGSMSSATCTLGGNTGELAKLATKKCGAWMALSVTLHVPLINSPLPLTVKLILYSLIVGNSTPRYL